MLVGAGRVESKGEEAFCHAVTFQLTPPALIVFAGSTEAGTPSWVYGWSFSRSTSRGAVLPCAVQLVHVPDLTAVSAVLRVRLGSAGQTRPARIKVVSG